jgi:hypothetical protein
MIENRLPKKQKAQGDISAKGLISIRKGVIGQCRRHHSNHTLKAPVRVAALAGDQSADRSRTDLDNPIIRHSEAVLKENRRDLPQLPNRMPESRKAPRRNATLPMLTVQ